MYLSGAYFTHTRFGRNPKVNLPKKKGGAKVATNLRCLAPAFLEPHPGAGFVITCTGVGGGYYLRFLEVVTTTEGANVLPLNRYFLLGTS